MGGVIYVLCAATSSLCAALLVRGYCARRTPLLLWASLCFAFLAVNNLLLVADMIIFPHTDLAVWRSGSALVGLMLLVYGLVEEAA
jgi:hypothetical protein